MTVPGSNLLNQALTVIQKQTFQYLKLQSNVINDIGLDIPAYDAPVDAEGSIQAVPRSLFQHLGLNWKKNYVMVYTSNPDIIGTGRGTAGDQFIFDGNTFQVESENEWRPIDGWAGILCVEILPNE